MHRADLRKVDLPFRERKGRQSERADLGQVRRRVVRAAQGHETHRCLSLAVDVEQGVDLVIGKSEHDPRGKSRIGGYRQQVGERGRRIPVDVAIGAGLVAPGVAPEGARPDRDEGSGSDRRLPPGCRDDGCPIVSRAQPAQAVIVCRVLIDARLQPGQLTADEIELEVIPRAGCAGGAELELTPGRTPPALEQAVRAETEPGNRVQVRDRARRLELASGRYGIERGKVRCGEFSWQWYRVERRVDLVRQRLDGGVLLAYGPDKIGRLAHQNLGVGVMPETGWTDVLRRVMESPRR